MRLLRSLLFASLLACLGCPEAPEPPHLLYSQDANALENPFPDLRLVKDGSFQARPDWFRAFLPPSAIKVNTVGLLKAWSAQASYAKGFGNLGLLLINPSEPLDPATLGGTVSRLKKVGSGYELLEQDVAVEHALSALEGTGKTPDESYPKFILVRPSVVLPEGSEGLLVFRKGMKTASGQALGRGRDFENEKGSKELIAAAAKALSIKEEDVLLVLPLRAELVTPPIKALAEWTKTMPVPAYTIPAKTSVNNGPVGTWKSTEADWPAIRDFLEKHSFARPAQHVGQVVFGTFKARELRENGVWKDAWVADPSSAPLMDLDFTVTLPVGARPAGGWRVVIGAHGLNGNNSALFGGNAPFCTEVGELLAKVGVACIGLDAANHGRRGNSFDFFALDDLTKVRENFRQTIFDMMQLSRLAQAIDLDADGQADFAPDLGYFGNSLGGIMGANFLSFDPRVKYGLLNVPGAGLSNILASPVIRDQIGLLLVAKTNLIYQSSEYFVAIPVFRALGQLMLEQADPLNLGQAMDPSLPVLLQMGIDDLTILNLTTRDLAKGLQIPELTAPKTDAAGVRALYPMDPKKYLSADRFPGYNGHNIFWEGPASPVRNQAARYIQTRGTELIVD